MYQQRKDGGFRARASFPVTVDMVLGLNEIAEATGQSVQSVCVQAIKEAVERHRIGSSPAPSIDLESLNPEAPG